MHNNTNEYPVIIDSGATHHTWTDPTAFNSFAQAENYYISLDNDYQIRMKGVGLIHLKVNRYMIQLHSVYYVPDLQYCLYSVK